MSRQHLNWSVNQHQLALLEFASVQQSKPPGVYVSTTPGAPTVWQGVYFVRRGTYAPAVLRFRLILPPEFPERAPALVFASELFHPLVVPLSTYTFSNASPPRRPQTAGDALRLAPGSLNLAFGFPEWFRRRRGQEVANGQQPVDAEREGGAGMGKTTAGDKPPASDGSEDEDSIDADEGPDFSGDEYGQDTPSKKPTLTSASVDGRDARGKIGRGVAGIPKRLMFMPPPAVDALEYSSKRSYSGIGAVLEYMVQAFEDDAFLDGVGVDDAANPSALHAWAAHRVRVKEIEEAKRLKEEKNKNNNNNDGPASATAAAALSIGAGGSGIASGASTPRSGGTGTPRGARGGSLFSTPTAGSLGSRLRGADDNPRGPRDPSQWDWSGVWQERVRKCVRDSISEARLYKEGAGGVPSTAAAAGNRREDESTSNAIEMIRFLDLEKGDVKLVKDRLRFAQEEATAAKLDISAIGKGEPPVPAAFK